MTVTTKAKDYIFILYAGGMTSIKVAALPEVREKLGYAALAKSNATFKGPSAWANPESPGSNRHALKKSGRILPRRWHVDKVARPEFRALFGSGLVLGILALLGVIYLLRSYSSC